MKKVHTQLIWHKERLGTTKKSCGAGEQTQYMVCSSMYRINLWFPSMCHIAFGAGTEYCLRLSVRLAMARTSFPIGSTPFKESRTLVTTTTIANVKFQRQITWNINSTSKVSVNTAQVMLIKVRFNLWNCPFHLNNSIFISFYHFNYIMLLSFNHPF